jgi:hypothetical protein
LESRAGFNAGVARNDSALTQAQAWWDQAIAAYPIDKFRAYYCLSRVAHLLGDLGVPDHVHNDLHSGGYLNANIPLLHVPERIDRNNFSNFEEYSKLEFKQFTADDTDIIYLENLPLELPEGYVPANFDKELAKLFYNQAQFTQHFDSSSEDGNSSPRALRPPEAGEKRKRYPGHFYLNGLTQEREDLPNIDGAIQNDGLDWNLFFVTLQIFTRSSPGAPVLWTDYRVIPGRFSSGNFPEYFDQCRGKGVLLFSIGSFEAPVLAGNQRIIASYIYRTREVIATGLPIQQPIEAVPDFEVAEQAEELLPQSIAFTAALLELFIKRVDEASLAPPIMISGRVTSGLRGNGLDGIIVEALGLGKVKTAGGGHFSIQVPKGWSGKVSVPFVQTFWVNSDFFAEPSQWSFSDIRQSEYGCDFHFSLESPVFFKISQTSSAGELRVIVQGKSDRGVTLQKSTNLRDWSEGPPLQDLANGYHALDRYEQGETSIFYRVQLL